MLKDLMSLLEEKMDKKPMNEKCIRAKMDVLEELIGKASDKAGDSITGDLQKVTVAAKDKQGLEKGLEKAQEMVEKVPQMKEESDSMVAENEEELSDESKKEIVKQLLAKDEEEEDEEDEDYI